jgi:hypothetical protein
LLPPAGIRRCNIALTRPRGRGEIVDGILSANSGEFAASGMSAFAFFFLDFGDYL